MALRALRLREGCVLDWKCFFETGPEAHMPRGNLFLLSVHVLPAAHSGSKLVDVFLQVHICASVGQGMAVICLTLNKVLICITCTTYRQAPRLSLDGTLNS